MSYLINNIKKDYKLTIIDKMNNLSDKLDLIKAFMNALK